MDSWLKGNLVCPSDHANLQLKGDTLVCALGHRYPYIDDIPIMMPETASQEFSITLEQAKRINPIPPSRQSEAELHTQGAVDPYVQQWIQGTCGLMYAPLTNKLSRYPIPELRLPLASGQRFLDIGCNWGRWCISATRKGYACVGIDPWLDAIQAARRVSRQLGLSISYVVADARYLPFRTSCFDVAFSYSVLQHLSKTNVMQSIAEISRVLKMSGTSLIEMPNRFGMVNLHFQLKKGFKQAKAPEVQYWTPAELRNTFGNLLGQTSLSVDGFFSLNSQKSDIDLLPSRYRLLVRCSEVLRKISEKMSWLIYLADSLYVQSTREAVQCMRMQIKPQNE